MVNTNPIFYDSMTLIKPLLLLSKRTTHEHILCTPESPNDGVLQSANFLNSWRCQSCRTKQLKEQCKYQCKCNCQCQRKCNGKCTLSWHLLFHSFAGCKLLKQLAQNSQSWGTNYLFQIQNTEQCMSLKHWKGTIYMSILKHDLCTSRASSYIMVFWFWHPEATSILAEVSCSYSIFSSPEQWHKPCWIYQIQVNTHVL